MAKSRYSVQGKTVLITGAARGIGAEVARRLASRGARLSLVGLEPDELDRVARACGPDAVWFEADVTDRDALDAAVSGTVERTGGIDVAIANAGIASAGFMRTVDPATWERVVEVNLLGVFRTIHACLPHVIARRGYLLPVASVAAVTPYFPGMSSYAASKAGVEGFGRALSTEVAHLGVDVGVAYFSWIATDMVSGADEHRSFRYLRERLKGPVSKTHPLPKAADAVVRGVERRASTVGYPTWIPALMGVRGLMRPMIMRDVAPLVARAEELFEEERAERGEAVARPVGAGGAADAKVSGFEGGSQASGIESRAPAGA